jgi:protein-S-isoprenylcysteine O-methyltransferase Ste14
LSLAVSANVSFWQRGAAWVVAQFALMAAVLVLAWRFHSQEFGTIAIWFGGALLALGGVFGMAGVVALGRSITPLPQPSLRARLVQRGIYARVRHPLYTSVMLIALGWALAWQSGPALGAALALIPFFHAKARREERWLREAFPDYGDYERRVPRFIPRLR